MAATDTNPANVVCGDRHRALDKLIRHATSLTIRRMQPFLTSDERAICVLQQVPIAGPGHFCWSCGSQRQGQVPAACRRQESRAGWPRKSRRQLELLRTGLLHSSARRPAFPDESATQRALGMGLKVAKSRCETLSRPCGKALI
jgi:hypothetical protein